jgi:RHS repeat-associated protein
MWKIVAADLRICGATLLLLLASCLAFADESICGNNGFECTPYQVTAENWPVSVTCAADNGPQPPIAPPNPLGFFAGGGGGVGGLDSAGAAAAFEAEQIKCVHPPGSSYGGTVCGYDGPSPYGLYEPNLPWTGGISAGGLQRYVLNILRLDANGGCTSAQPYQYAVTGRNAAYCPAGWDHGIKSDGDYFCYRNVFCPDCQQAVGNPITLGSGDKALLERDYSGGGPFPLHITRYYNAQGSALALGDAITPALPLGQGWKLNYHRSLTTYTSAVLSLVTLKRETGLNRSFTLGAGNTVIANAYEKGTLERLTDGLGVLTGWRYRNVDDEIETYSATGRLQSLTNRAGLIQTLAYNAAGQLGSVTDAYGRQLTFDYWPEGQVKSITAPGASVFGYAYTSSRSLSEVTYPDTLISAGRHPRRYHHDEPTFPWGITRITDERNIEVAKYTYYLTGTPGQGLGQAHTTELFGGVNRYAVGAGSSVYVTDPLLTERLYTFTKSSTAKAYLLTARRQPNPLSAGAYTWLEFQHDANGNVSQRKDDRGNFTNYIFDNCDVSCFNPIRNLETTRVEAAGTPQERTIKTEWHPTFRLPAKVIVAGRETTYTHDTAGNVLTKTVQDAPPSGTTHTWIWTYNAAGQPFTINGPRTDVTDVTTNTYDASGNLETSTNARGHLTQYQLYDAHGMPGKIIDPNGVQTLLTYDDRQRLTSRSTAGETTAYTYDSIGQLTFVTAPDGSWVHYEYDGARRLAGIDDSFGNSIDYALDNMGNRTEEKVNDHLGVLRQSRTREFDALSRLSVETGMHSQRTEYARDGNGNVTKTKEALNAATPDNTTISDYDALDRLTRVTDPTLAGDTSIKFTKYGYNALDQLVSVTDRRNNETSYTIDALGNLKQQVSPDTGTTVNTFDDAGNLATSTDARGKVAVYAYDALNRVKTISWATQPSENIAFIYDEGTNGIGRLTGMLDATGTTSWSYDALGRVTARTQVHAGSGRSFITGYAWTAGRLTELAYPSGAKVAYEYLHGRVSAIKLKGVAGAVDTPILANVGYHPFGPAKSWTWGNGSGYSRSIDTDGRIAAFPLGATAKQVAFDLANRITGITEADSAKSFAYGYDLLHHLTSQTVGSGGSSTLNQLLGYDEVGNRITHTVGATTRTYTTQTTSNRLLSVSGLKTNTFDAAGNITNNSLQSWTYDSRGRMKTNSGATGVTTYGVNGLGQRVQKTHGALTTHFAFDENGHLLGEYGPAGVLNREHVWLEDLPVATLSVTAPIEDIDADRSPDIVLRSTVSGDTWAWLLNPDLTLKSDALMAGVDTAWDLVAVVDFNGDGKLDLLWRSSVSGAAYVWYMNGTSFVSDAFLFSVDPIWKVAAVADMNGDGKPDVVLRHKTTGATWVWYFNGTQFLSDAYLFTEDPVWKIVGAADFDLDGKTDLVLEHATNGSSFVRYLNGAQVVGDQPLFNIDPAWRISRVADMNRDGRPDIIYRHTTSGIAYAWYLEDRTFLGDALLMNVDPVWQQQSVQEGLQKALSTSSRPVNRPLPQGFAKPRPDKTPPAVRPAPRLESAQARLQPVRPSEFRGTIPPGPTTPTKPAGKAQTKVAATRIQIHYVFADQIGSPRVITRPSDNVVVWRWDNIDAFGNNAANENPGGLGTFTYNLRFPGQYFDAETGLHYNYFRDFDPSTGRYVESDPVGLDGGINTYAYGGSNPLVNIDPEGLTYFCMYSQSSGRFSCFDNDGKGKQVIDDPGCYAGNGQSKNNPADQCKKDQGPLPRGWYDIGSGYNHRLGNPTFKLDPQPGTSMCTPLRDNMRIHADKLSSPGNASDGCIVCSKKTRDQLGRGGGGTLFVTQ